MKQENRELLEAAYIQGMLNRTLLAISSEQVELVRSATVAVAGLGGVGAITAELLARWGVKKFRLFDMDRYEPTNLNRQLFATSKTLGCWKVEAAERRILEINPFSRVEQKVAERVNNDNVYSFLSGATILILSADHPSAKLFHYASRNLKVPLIHGYAGLTWARVQTFDYRRSRCESSLERLWYRIKYGNQKPLPQMSPSEIEDFDREHVHKTAPSINFVTNTAGCLIVAEAIKLLTGLGRIVEYPRYLILDLFTHSLKIRNEYSPLNPDNLKRVIDVCSRRLFGHRRKR